MILVPRKQKDSTVLTGEPDRVMGAGEAGLFLKSTREKSRGERTQPCGEPLLMVSGLEVGFPSFSCCFLSDRKSVIHLQVESGTLSWESLSCSRAWMMLLNTEVKSVSLSVSGAQYENTFLHCLPISTCSPLQGSDVQLDSLVLDYHG